MATKIRLKRKKSSTNSNIKVDTGEPFYNIKDRHLYIGNSEQEDVTKKKHISEVSVVRSDSNGMKVQIGEDTKNTFEIIFPKVDIPDDPDTDGTISWKEF